jgi:shikimate 5-dehydrogenase
MAHELNCRHVRMEALYTTLHDVLIHGPDEVSPAARTVATAKDATIHPGYLKPGMTVMDLTTSLGRTDLLREAATRGCSVVAPLAILLEQVLAVIKLITGKDVPAEPLRQWLQTLYVEEEG